MHGDDESIRDTIREKIREVLGLAKDAEIDYKKHFATEAPSVPYKGAPPSKYQKKGAQGYGQITRSRHGGPEGKP